MWEKPKNRAEKELTKAQEIEVKFGIVFGCILEFFSTTFQILGCEELTLGTFVICFLVMIPTLTFYVLIHQEVFFEKMLKELEAKKRKCLREVYISYLEKTVPN